MKLFGFFLFALTAAVRVQKGEQVDKMQTAPMSCPEYIETMNWQQQQVDTCKARACRSAQTQLHQTQETFNAFCSSPTASPSPSNAPSFFPVSCFCMDYGSVTANTMILHDFEGTSDTQGTLYVGGNAMLQGYSVADTLPVACDDPSLVVRGSLDFQSGRVYSGNVLHGPGSQIPISLVDGLPRGCVAEEKDSGFDFDGAIKHYQMRSTHLCTLSNSGVILKDGLKLQATYNNDHMEIYSMSCEEYTKAQSMNFGGISDSATVVLNLRGDNCILNTETIAANNSNVLFNLCDATKVQIQSVGVHGSIMAPFGEISGHGGVVWGQIVAQSMKGETQQNNVMCKVCSNYV